MKRRDYEVFRKTKEALNNEARNVRIIELIVEASRHNPKNTPAQQLEKAVEVMLDLSGLCSKCEVERRAAEEYKSKMLIRIDKELAARRARKAT